eukprot:1867613-Rhodomonas_salina.1
MAEKLRHSSCDCTYCSSEGSTWVSEQRASRLATLENEEARDTAPSSSSQCATTPWGERGDGRSVCVCVFGGEEGGGRREIE